MSSLRLASGEHQVSGRLTWKKRPQALTIPAQTGLISLTIDGQAVAMVEALLETLWRDGLVGKVEAPSPNQFNAYCIRAAAETIAKQGVFIKLCPLAPQFQPKHKLRRLM